jgi:DNA-directed RNA polymerase specialized sigma24 family protein
MDSADFASFRAAIERGDADAAMAVLRQYQQQLDDLIHSHLRNGHALRPSDVRQSVLCAFLKRVKKGGVAFPTQGELWGYLGRMVRNRIVEENRKHRPGALPDGHDPAATPALDALANREQVDAVRRLLEPDELVLFDLRAEGKSWAEIADGCGGTPAGVRMRLKRARERVIAELNRRENGRGQ